MILYTLACDDGHRFESWFRDSASFDEHKARGLLMCPVCASRDVTKSIMAPAVVTTRAQDKAETAPLNVALADDASREVRAAVRRFREHLFAEGHDVGPRFADEARRIHDGEAPERKIYGQASIAEARDLLDEGIMVLPLPDDPDEMN